jgi:hypothetical protein
MDNSCSCLLVSLLLLFVIFGSAISVLNRFIYLGDNRDLSFSRDGFVNLLMFFSEMVGGLPIYSILLYQAKKNAKIELSLKEEEESSDDGIGEVVHLSTIKKIWLLGSPAFLDLLASFLSGFASIVLPTTTYIMIRGLCLIFITFLISKYLMANNHLWDHYIAIFIGIIAFIFTIVSLFFGANANLYEENGAFIYLIGIEFIIVSAIFQSTQFILEQKFMRAYLFHPFLFVGVEGVVGFVVNIILCIIFYHIKCSNAPGDIFSKICLLDNGESRFENILYTIREIFKNDIKIILVVFSIICMGGYNIIGICINKYGGALTRSVIDNFKSFLVWFFFLVMWNKEGLKINFDWYAFTGLILILLSIIIYFGPFKIDEKIEVRRRIRDITLRDNSLGNIIVSSGRVSEQIEF